MAACDQCGAHICGCGIGQSFRTYGFEYGCGGSQFSLTIVAATAQEALERLVAMRDASFVGELKAVPE